MLSGDSIYQKMVLEKRQVADQVALYRLQYGEGMVRPQLAKLDRLEAEMSDRAATIERLALADIRRQVVQGGRRSIDPNLTMEQQEALLAVQQLDEEARKRAELISEREIRVGVLRQQRERIEEDLSTLTEESKKLGRSSVDMEMMRAELVSLDEVLARLSGEIERTKIELKAGSRVTVISDATSISNSDVKKRYMATAALGAAGFFFPFLAFVGMDVRRKVVDTSDCIAKEAGVPLLGTIPKERQIARQFGSEDFTQTEYGNSINSIVAMLVKGAKFDDACVFMVTSAVPSEGKSSVSQGLWRGLSQAGYRVILIDMDMRRPSVHVHLEVPLGRGVGDVLIQEATVDDVIQVHSEGQDFITAGSNRRINIAATAREQLPNMIDELRVRYDFVIVDTPPILPVVDTRIIGEHVDGAILSVMRDRSQVTKLVAAVETLKAHGTRLTGVVVNGTKRASKDYGRYYG